MHQSRQRISYLLNRYLQQTITEAEHEELMNWLAESADEEMLTEILREAWEMQETGVHEELDALKRNQIIQKILTEGRTADISLTYTHRNKKEWNSNIRKYAAILVLLGVVAYLFKTKPDAENLKAEQPRTEKMSNNDILPGSRKATLIVSREKAITLTDQLLHQLDDRGQVKMTHPGELVYHTDTGEDITDEQHILSVPRGGEYRLILPDGTRVWLNSASEIRYPPVFGAERIVNVSGEVYFEVAKDNRRPFIVEVNDIRIKVLGTAFNVSAYLDDPLISTTLVEGAIRVEHGNQHSILTPGERANVLQNGDLRVQKADIHRDIAWKNGFFYFEDASIEEIMDRVSRWYDIDVTYENIPTKKLTGKFPRTVTLSRFLQILEFAGIQFELLGKHIVIKD